MAEPTSILTYYDLILRVAELAGVAYYGSGGDERALIPVDAHEFDKCKRVVNDAIRMFIAHAPKTGWRWKNRIMSVTFGSVETTGECDSAGDSTSLIDSDLADVYDTDDEIVGYYVYDITQGFYGICTAYTATTGDITVSSWLDYDGAASSLTPADEDSYAITDVQTVEGDKARYLLDEDFGRVAGKLTYAKDSSRGHILEWRSEGFIRERREVDVLTGYPRYAAVRRYRNQRRWEIIVDPSPTATDKILFPYEVGFDGLQMECGLATNGAATAISNSGLANVYPDDFYNGWRATVISGTGKGATAIITSYVGADGEFFVADWLYSDGTAAAVNPASGSAYYVEPAYNKHPAGLLFDDAILSACKAKAEMKYDEVAAGFVQQYHQVDLPRAHDADKRTAPRKLGRMGSGGSRYVGRNWDNPPYYDSDGSLVEA